MGILIENNEKCDNTECTRVKRKLDLKWGGSYGEIDFGESGNGRRGCQLALSILELKMEEVRIEVVSNPIKKLFGLRKMMAEVNVTQIIEQTFL